MDTSLINAVTLGNPEAIEKNFKGWRGHRGERQDPLDPVRVGCVFQ